jgi:multisubunit Na+/H+ antiporter MnhC subunit
MKSREILRKEKKPMKKILAIIAGSFTALLGLFSSAMAEFTLPTLPTSDLETAGTSVAALIATAVVIGVVFRLLKRA